jgi:hypothetical protein
MSALSEVETPPARVIRDWILRGHVPGSRIGPLSQPGRDFTPGDAHGIYIPFAALLCLAGDDAFGRLAPTCRLALRIAASFIVAGSIQAGRTMIRLASASGVWPREAAVPCNSLAPL